MYDITSIKYKVEHDKQYLILHQVCSLALQPLSAGNSTEFSKANNSKTTQHRAVKFTSLDSLCSCESIYVGLYFKPIKLVET